MTIAPEVARAGCAILVPAQNGTGRVTVVTRSLLPFQLPELSRTPVIPGTGKAAFKMIRERVRPAGGGIAGEYVVACLSPYDRAVEQQLRQRIRSAPASALMVRSGCGLIPLTQAVTTSTGVATGIRPWASIIPAMTA